MKDIVKDKKLKPQSNSNFLGQVFSAPSENFDEMTPRSYFEMFWKPGLNELIAKQTNLYSVQKSGVSVNTNHSEIETLIGTQIQISVIKLPTYRMYWEKRNQDSTHLWRYVTKPISEVERKFACKWQQSKDLEENKENKLFKISPVLDHVRGNCLLVEPEQGQSIDEQIIPVKTKYSGIRQYNPKKPVK